MRDLLHHTHYSFSLLCYPFTIHQLSIWLKASKFTFREPDLDTYTRYTNMNDNLDELFSDGDDDLILQLSTRPAKASTQHAFPSQTDSGSAQPSQVDQSFIDQLNRAQGEASMLRDKIRLLNKQWEREKLEQSHLKEDLETSHSREVSQLKLELQNVEDEKKFLVMEARKTASRSNARVVQPEHPPQVAQEQEPLKKRRIEHLEEKKKPYVPLNAAKVPFDEASAFYDFLMAHKAVGATMTTLETLDRVRLNYIEEFGFKSLLIPKGHSVGQSIVRLLLQCKQNMALDAFIDILLEHLAALIKEITSHKQESKLAVPFLVSLMYQSIVFRPSAVRTLALRDLLLFTCDLIRAYQHVLKQPLHSSPYDIYSGPQIFQYELLDNLVILYSFDVLETTLRILRSQSPEMYGNVLDGMSLKSLEQVYQLALTISYKPILHVIFNTIEILNLLSNLVLDTTLVDAKWWRDCIARLYTILAKGIKNNRMFAQDDVNVFYYNKFYDCFGLIRNVGTNQVGRLIPHLIYEEVQQAMPRVIPKESVAEIEGYPRTNSELESWLLRLKMDILNIFDNLLIVYPSIGDGTMLIQLTKLMSNEQELMIERGVGQQSTNLHFHCRIIEHLLTLIHTLWTNHQPYLKQDQVKEVESELVMSLWRIIEPRDHKEDSIDLRDSVRLVDALHELKMNDQASCFDDALEDIPPYIEKELNTDLNDRTAKIMQVRYDSIYQDMARGILESKMEALTSVDDIDSLYLAMGV
ncbi:LCD1 (YDR499W) [Zygosaccharomyces parabailii]|nr:LCD1 (YDR499W) [Zygosaccharomyces parabailii]